ncbi:MAG: hypothetical protein DMF49_10090 [Acidobacteria bacterium]|nr:MAG: hypothetical protein DMF49_10090 [Acidobacteriota bacterium]
MSSIGSTAPGAPSPSPSVPTPPAATPPPGPKKGPSRRKRRHPLLRALRIGSGSLLLLVGFIAGLLPILQGWIFVLAGLSLLSTEVRLVRKGRIIALRRYRRWRRSRSRPGVTP